MKQNIIVLKHCPTDVLGTLPDVLQKLNLSAKVIDITDPLPPVEAVPMAIIMGCFDAAYDDSLPWLAAELAWVKQLLAAKVPILGICFGGQLLARAAGGRVYRNTQVEHAWADMTLCTSDWPHPGPWFTYHFDAFEVPPEGVLLAKTALANQAFRYGHSLAVQFHPEMNADMFANWLSHWQSSPEGKAYVQANQAMIDGFAQQVEARTAANQRNFEAMLRDFLGQNASC